MGNTRLLLFITITAGSALAQVTAGAQSYQPTAFSYHPMTAQERLKWFAKGSFGPTRVSMALLGSGIDTWRNSPEEWGPHWDGYGKRFAARVGETTVSHGIEASVGAIWGEDPRYYPVPDKPLGARLRNVVKMTFVSHDRNGNEMPAYARFAAVSSSAFIADAWLPPSRQSTTDAMSRMALDFSGHMLGNAFHEFWPDLKRRLPGHHKSPNGTQDALLPEVSATR